MAHAAFLKNFTIIYLSSRLQPLLNMKHIKFSCRFFSFLPTQSLTSTSISFVNYPLSSYQLSRFSTVAVAGATSVEESFSFEASSMPLSSKAKKKARREAPENLLKHKLDMCSKHNDLKEALRLYDDARVQGISLSLHHYNVLLYLCSSLAQSILSSSGSCLVESSSKSELDKDGKSRVSLGLEKGFEIYKQMGIDKIAPNEASFTSLARLAAAKEDPELAFDLVKQMKNCGIPPKLRSYGPALFGFCKKGDADKAYEVDAHMIESGVVAEEPELSALFRVSGTAKKADKVYEMLHRLRASVRQLSEDTAGVMKDWFTSKVACEVGIENWDVVKVKEGIIRGGGGWHGQGWLGKGEWKVVRSEIDEAGICRSCGEKLVSIDIDPRETESFASSLAALACQRQVKSDFTRFQEWLRHHGPFDAVVDGANLGLINQHNFSFFQLNNVVNQLQDISAAKKLPLVVLHRSRVYGGPATDPRNKKLLERWKKSGALYSTPPGSNDDWYWLYAAVSSKGLLVTNDEMRDHLFQLLGNNFFPRWKEKHQVRLSVSRKGIFLHMPPPYSKVIQESEGGCWHIPTTTGNDVESPKQWLCVTRPHCRASLSGLFANGV